MSANGDRLVLYKIVDEAGVPPSQFQFSIDCIWNFQLKRLNGEGHDDACITLCASQAAFMTEKLQDLRTVDIVVRNLGNAFSHAADLESFGLAVSQLLRHVRASNVPYNAIRWEAPCQEQCASAAWNLTCGLTAALSRR